MPIILIIDDHVENANLLQATLERFRLDVLVAHTGKDGFDMAYIHEPDLIFTDLRMPQDTWTGYVTAKELKSNDSTAHIPVIALTAVGDGDLALRSGCDAVLRRPYDKQDLISILDRFLPLPM